MPLPHALAGAASINWPNWECELTLIAARADLEARNENGETALMVGGGYLERGDTICYSGERTPMRVHETAERP